jgi:hypothetical protein
MKTKDAELLAKVIRESSKAATVGQESAPPSRRALKVDEEKMLRLRRLFDEKYSISTPRELMKI